jgi:4'-phosphopantetheinyl transferase
MPISCINPDGVDGADSSADMLALPFGVESETNIRICRVDMAALIQRWFGHMAMEDLRRPARRFDAHPRIEAWLAPEEQEALNHFKSFKRQVEWLAGRLAVKALVAGCLGAELPAPEIRVAHDPQGAPFLPGFPDHCISITHAGRFAAAAVSLDPRIALGIDIERLPIPAGDAFLKVAFSDRERQALDPGDGQALARSWTLKEAYLKYIRQGFHRSLHRVEWLNGRLLDGGRTAPVHWEVMAPSPDHRLAVVWGAASAPRWG